LLCILATTIGLHPTLAQTSQQMQAVEKARANVLKRGTGRTSRVEIKLRDNSKVTGYISDAGADSVVVTDLRTGASQTISYADVVQVKKPGSGLSTRTWLIIGGVAAAVVIVGIAVKPAVCDGGAQTRFPC
jgi:hypothetical protein